MPITKMKHLDNLHIEQIIRLPFFYSLKKSKLQDGALHWEVVFKCNKITASGQWALLDFESDTEFITRYKLIEFYQPINNNT